MSFSSFLSSKLENDIRRLASGDIDALHGIYEQTKDSVFVFALRKLGSRTRAEDAMQETYLRIAKCAASYAAGTNARAWIFGICRNICRDMLKRSRVEYIDSLESEPSEADFSDSLIENEDIKRALAGLEKTEHEIVMLHIYSDMKLVDIADFIGMPYNSVRSKYRYAMKKLKSELGNAYQRR